MFGGLFVGLFFDFQTIESILKLDLLNSACEPGLTFPDYWVYFKARIRCYKVYEEELFPDYWVYFKAMNRIEAANLAALFPDYWVYFKAYKNECQLVKLFFISRLLSLF